MYIYTYIHIYMYVCMYMVHRHVQVVFRVLDTFKDSALVKIEEA